MSSLLSGSVLILTTYSLVDVKSLLFWKQSFFSFKDGDKSEGQSLTSCMLTQQEEAYKSIKS